MFGKVLGRLITGVLLGCVLGTLAVAYAVWKVARTTDDVQADTIVVLGSAQYNGTPSPVFQWRLQQALDLYREGHAPVIVTVGGAQSGDNFSEAEAGRDWLVNEGDVDPDAVLAVPEGGNTLESAVALKPVFADHGWHDAIVVTDPPHTLRAKSMIAAQGIETYGSPTRSGPAVQTRGTQLKYIVRETGALLYYGIFGGSPETGAGIG